MSRFTLLENNLFIYLFTQLQQACLVYNMYDYAYSRVKIHSPKAKGMKFQNTKHNLI